MLLKMVKRICNIRFLNKKIVTKERIATTSIILGTIRQSDAQVAEFGNLVGTCNNGTNGVAHTYYHQNGNNQQIDGLYSLNHDINGLLSL